MKLEIADESKFKDIKKRLLEEKLINLRLLLTPYVTDEEQTEIEESYGEPSKKVVRFLILNLN